MDFVDIIEAKEVYENGENVTQYLQKKFGKLENTSEIIQIAYDLQAGSYIKNVIENRPKYEEYATELANILNQQIKPGDTLLDIGTGELTNLSLVLNKLSTGLSEILAFDISWSRLKKGIVFFENNNTSGYKRPRVFVADIKQIPLHSRSVDVVMSSHALEPNGNSLPILLRELMRITKRKLVLFEPSYELNSNKGKRRMDRLGYIKNIEREVDILGGKVVEVIPIVKIENSLNPTACYIIEPPETKQEPISHKTVLCVPGADLELSMGETFMESSNTGLLFPVLDGIPILIAKAAILASAKF